MLTLTANLENLNSLNIDPNVLNEELLSLTNAEDGLPEPPSFLRDIVYPTDSDRDPRYDSDGAMPYHPPSPGRQRQVTILISSLYMLSRNGSRSRKAMRNNTINVFEEGVI